MRSVSLTLREAMNAQETGEVLVWLLTFEHPNWPDPLRLSSDPTTRLSEEPLQYGTISNGETYLFYPMSITPLNDVDQQSPTSQILTENVSRDLIALVRSITTRGTCRVVVVRAADPDSVEVEYPILDLLGNGYNSDVLTLDLGRDGREQEPIPSGTFTPSGFPGLFA